MSKLTSFVVVALTALVGSADATVCRLPGLNGYEIAAARAKQYLPPTTSNISEMAVYIERDPNGSFYFHSNFKSEGADHPTKIGGEPDIVDLENALINIVFTEFPSRAEQTALRRAMLKDVKIFVNPDVFDGDGTTKLDFSGRLQVVFVDHEAKVSTGGLIIRTDRPPPFGAERIDGCCVNGRPPGSKARNLRTTLHNSKVQTENVRLISLVSDTATVDAIAGSSLKNMAVNAKSNKSFSEADLETIFSKNSGKDIIVLGHVENGQFVTRDGSGEIISSVSIPKLRAAAQKNDVLLIEVGCNTAGVAQGATVGIATRFNTVDAANRLAKALDGAINLGQFFNKLADESLQVVVDAQLIESRTQYRAAFFESRGVGTSYKQVGEVTVTTRDSSLLGRLLPRWLRP